MNQCVMQQNAFASGDRKAPVFCPKPRRIGQLVGPDPIGPLRWQPSYQPDLYDSKVGPELLDVFLTKGGDMASWPPFFCGSPPTNPLVRDVRFGEDKPVLALTGVSGNPGSLISPHKICAPRGKFRFNLALIRVVGSDSLDRDSPCNQSVTATA